jgi:AAA15 family ATPase/GTPase
MISQHLNSFTVSNYRCFRHTKASHFSKINLIGGLNGVGKSNFLEAIFHLVDRANITTWLRPYQWRNLPIGASDTLSALHKCFHDGDLKHKISLSGNLSNSDVELTCTYGEQTIKKLSTSEVKLDNINNISSMSTMTTSGLGFRHTYKTGSKVILDASVIIGDVDLTIEINENNISAGPSSSISNNFTRGLPSDLALRFTAIANAGQLKTMKAYVNSINPDIEDLQLLMFGGQSVIHAALRSGTFVPLPFLGEGMVSLVSVFLAMHHCKNGIVLLDEIDNAVHYSKLSDLWAMIANLSKLLNVQVFATTHSQESLRAFVNAMKENSLISNSSYTRFHKNPEGNPIISNYTDEEIVSALELGWELR